MTAPRWAAVSVAVACVVALTVFAGSQVLGDPDNADLGAGDKTQFVALLSLFYAVVTSPVIALLACLAGFVMHGIQRLSQGRGASSA